MNESDAVKHMPKKAKGAKISETFAKKHRAITRGRWERRFKSAKDTFKRANPTARFFVFLLLCITINNVGLFVTQGTSSSMFYFDTIGTALASLLSGLTGGLIVGFYSNILGAYLIGEPSYAFFGFSNASCAIVWAFLPRLGIPVLGSDILHPVTADGYARQISRIFVVGFLAAIASSITAFFVQTTLLSIHIDTVNNLVNAVSGGSNVAKNNIILVAALMESIHFNISTENSSIIFMISSLSSNLPDKIISTAISVILIMSFFKVPRINKQSQSIKNNSVSTSQFYNGVFVYLSTVFVSYIYIYLNITVISMSCIIFLTVFLIVLLFARLARHDIARVADPYGTTTIHNSLFYKKFHLENPMSFQRDVLEDTLKIILVVFSITQFIINYRISPLSLGNFPQNGIIHNSINIIIDGKVTPFDMPAFSTMLVYNALILTGLRYSVIVFIRLFGRF
jgi:hypothetical protein